jgi:phosphate transport system permease protein
VADVMNGTPSIVVGVFAWAWIVSKQGRFSALADNAAAGMLMIPWCATREMKSWYRIGGGAALSYSRWRTA